MTESTKEVDPVRGFLAALAVVAGLVGIIVAVALTGPSDAERAEWRAQAEATAARWQEERERQERLFADCMQDMEEYRCEALLRRSR